MIDGQFINDATHCANIQEQREFFDKLAPSWREKDILCREAVEGLLKDIPLEGGMRVLDVACGAGVLDECLLKKGLKVDAIDISPCMIEKARNNRALFGVNFAVADFYEYKSEYAYDCLLVFDAYPHFTHKIRFAQKAHELLNDGGTLWIFFDECRVKINGHHTDHKSSISVGLDSAENEAKAFEGLFDVICMRDDSESYCLGLKKRVL